MNVGIYARVSTQEQANNYSVDEQISRMQDYCKALGWTVYNRYIDAGFSGANTDRPALQKLILAAKTRKIEKVLVYKLDRLSRSQKDTLYLIEDVFVKNGVDFVSVTESLDTATALGKAMIGIMAAFAQLERETIKERMTMGKEARIRSGKWTGGVTPFGYDYDKESGCLIVNGFEAMQVKELFERYAAGEPFNGIRTDFINKGYSLRNNPWTMWSMRYILENRVYCGFIRFKDTWIRGTHEPIISEETFEKAADVGKYNKLRYESLGVPAGGKKNLSTILGGLIFCGVCGNKYGKRQAGQLGKRYDTYACYSRMKNVRTKIKDPSCKNKIYHVDDLEKIVFDEIRKLRFAPLRQEATKPEQDKVPVLQAEIESIERQISRFLDLYGIGRFSAETLDKKIKPLEDRKASLEAEIDMLITKPKMPLKSIENAIVTFDDVLQYGSFAEIRAVVETLIDRIVINGDDVEIHWNFQQ